MLREPPRAGSKSDRTSFLVRARSVRAYLRDRARSYSLTRRRRSACARPDTAQLNVIDAPAILRLNNTPTTGYKTQPRWVLRASCRRTQKRGFCRMLRMVARPRFRARTSALHFRWRRRFPCPSRCRRSACQSGPVVDAVAGRHLADLHCASPSRQPFSHLEGLQLRGDANGGGPNGIRNRVSALRGHPPALLIRRLR